MANNKYLDDVMAMTPDQLLLLARTSFECFALAIQPGFESAPHTRLMIERIEQVLRGRTRKLGLVAPPRHGKSNLCSILLPAYFLGRNPASSVICASYSGELSENFGRKVRNIVGSPLFNSIFPNCRLSPDSQAAHRFATTLGGEFSAVGRGGPMTGKGGALIVLDDLLKDSDEARSDAVTRSVIDWLQHVVMTRGTGDGKIVAVSTRWSAKDPMGFLLQQPGWESVVLPAVSQGDGDPLNRPLGTALWESHFPLPVLQSIRAAIGSNAWNCLYLGDPIAALGDVFQRSWFKYYDAPPAKFDRVVSSWDTAFKTGAANDYSACVTIGTTDTHYYVLDVWRGKLEFPELKRQFVALAEMWRPSEILLEDKSSGISLIQELQTSTDYPVIPVKVDSDKTTRAAATTGYFEAGKILFARDASWRADLEDELCAFPRGAHDDQTDALVQALNFLRNRSGVFGFLDWAAGVAKGIFAMPEKAPEPSRSAEIFAIQKSLRGLTDTSTSGGPASWKVTPTPPCPKCRETITVRVGGGGIRCNACGVQFDEPGRELEILTATRDRGVVLRTVKR
jgi:predicted phage terminase large subunit-like protein